MKFVVAREEITESFVTTYILPHLPDTKSGTSFRLFGHGWDNFALEVGQYVVRLPRDEGAVPKLMLEERVSQIVKNPSVATPDLSFLKDIEYPFAFHHTIPGDVLLEAEYMKLSDDGKDALADKLAHFFKHMHSVDVGVVHALGVEAGYPRIRLDEFVTWYPKLAHVLDEGKFNRFLKYFEAILADSDTPVFGHFDVHGWNMAFDHHTSTLNGVFDFGEVCIEKRHLDFWPPNSLNPDLARRTALQYTTLTGVPIDLAKVNSYTLLDEYSNLFGVFIDEGRISKTAPANIDRWWNELSFA